MELSAALVSTLTHLADESGVFRSGSPRSLAARRRWQRIGQQPRVLLRHGGVTLADPIFQALVVASTAVRVRIVRRINESARESLKPARSAIWCAGEIAISCNNTIAGEGAPGRVWVPAP